MSQQTAKGKHHFDDREPLAYAYDGTVMIAKLYREDLVREWQSRWMEVTLTPEGEEVLGYMSERAESESGELHDGATLTDLMASMSGSDADQRVVEVALDHYPDSSQLRDEKHFIVMAETNKEAVEKAYDLADEDYPHWSDADAVIVGSHLPGGGKEHKEGEALQRNGAVFGPEVEHNGI